MKSISHYCHRSPETFCAVYTISDLFLQHSNLRQKFLFLQIVGSVGKITLARWLLGG